MLNKILEQEPILIEKFIKTSALSKENAKTLLELDIDANKNYLLFSALSLYRHKGYIKKNKNKFWLDNYALHHPVKTYFKKFIKIFIISLVLISILSTIFVILTLNN